MFVATPIIMHSHNDISPKTLIFVGGRISCCQVIHENYPPYDVTYAMIKVDYHWVNQHDSEENHTMQRDVHSSNLDPVIAPVDQRIAH